MELERSSSLPKARKSAILKLPTFQDFRRKLVLKEMLKDLRQSRARDIGEKIVEKVWKLPDMLCCSSEHLPEIKKLDH